MKEFHLHLVSDSTGETIHSVARACLAQFEDIKAIEHSWVMVRSEALIDRVVDGVNRYPGVVLFTLVNAAQRQRLIDRCRVLQAPCIPVLDPVLSALSTHLELESQGKPGRQHAMDQNYFERMEAINFALVHDDGQGLTSISQADIILVGVSRTSKTPTCMYLANRGFRAANVPIVPGCPIPSELNDLSAPFIIGLTNEPDRLVQLRRNRVRMFDHDAGTDYTDPELLRNEVAWARRLFTEHGWPVINVTRRSIEETASTVIRMFEQRSNEAADG